MKALNKRPVATDSKAVEVVQVLILSGGELLAVLCSSTACLGAFFRGVTTRRLRRRLHVVTDGSKKLEADTHSSNLHRQLFQQTAAVRYGEEQTFMAILLTGCSVSAIACPYHQLI